jgi:hypothetical protein
MPAKKPTNREQQPQSTPAPSVFNIYFFLDEEGGVMCWRLYPDQAASETDQAALKSKLTKYQRRVAHALGRKITGARSMRARKALFMWALEAGKAVFDRTYMPDEQDKLLEDLYKDAYVSIRRPKTKERYDDIEDAFKIAEPIFKAYRDRNSLSNTEIRKRPHSDKIRKEVESKPNWKALCKSTAKDLRKQDDERVKAGLPKKNPFTGYFQWADDILYKGLSARWREKYIKRRNRRTQLPKLHRAL